MARMHTISCISGGLGVNDGFGEVDTSSLQTAVGLAKGLRNYSNKDTATQPNQQHQHQKLTEESFNICIA